MAENQLAEQETPRSSLVDMGNVFQNKECFDMALRGATALSRSTLVPTNYQGKPENCFIAVNLANRMGVDPMIVMQNLYVVQGKPSWAGQACMMLIKNCGEFRNVKPIYIGKRDTDTWGCYITANRISDGEVVNGAAVSIDTAKKESWYQKNGSKWQTMPELMLAYRAAAWFARVYCPEALMGMQTAEESVDVYNAQNPPKSLTTEQQATLLKKYGGGKMAAACELFGIKTLNEVTADSLPSFTKVLDGLK